MLETRPQGEPYDHEKVRPVPLFVRGAGRGARPLPRPRSPGPGDPGSHRPRPAGRGAASTRSCWTSWPSTCAPTTTATRSTAGPTTSSANGTRTTSTTRAATAATSPARSRSTPCSTAWRHPGPLDRGRVAVRGGRRAGRHAADGRRRQRQRARGVHDSATTLATLLPRIARLRDAFYDNCCRPAPGPHGARLRQEAAALRQPFGGARQHLNAYLARHRAPQLQQRHLSLLFADMGYPDASREEAGASPPPRPA